MDRQAVARILDQIAAFLEIKGENPFRVRAYQNAGRAVNGVAGDLADALASGSLAATRGIGPGTLDVIRDLLETGRSTLLEELKEHIPPDLVEMLRISGLGVSKVRVLHEQLGINTLMELEEAARDGRVAKLPRFGQKTADNILKGIAYLRRAAEYHLFHHALAEAEAVRRALLALGGVRRAEIAGSLRRRLELVRDLDLVVECGIPRHDVVTRLAEAPGVAEFIGRDEETVTLRFASGGVANVSLAEASNVGTALLRATGSEAHLIALGPLPEAATEMEIYTAAGLPFIVPELREGSGEIEAARQGALPVLVERRDLQGFIHCHTNYSDGSTTVAEWARACHASGYQWVGITDHSMAAAYAGGLAESDIGKQHAEVDACNASGSPCTVLKGIEADILADGTLDYTDEVLASFDFVIGSIHAQFSMSEQAMTARILKAMDDPNLTILGHPTGRLLLARESYPLNLDAILEKAAAEDVILEINADPRRLDLDWRTVRRAVEMGVAISIGADAHSAAGIGNVDYGVGIARKGWATRTTVINTLSKDEFLVRVAERRARVRR